jgi:protocatechuate 3,4-dioxygenase beta subunit
MDCREGGPLDELLIGGVTVSRDFRTRNEDMMMPDEDVHDRGLIFDLRTLLDRRRILTSLAGMTLLAGGSFGGPPDDAEANMIASAADGSVCVKDPGETSGPYPGDGTNEANGATSNVLTESGVVRQDIRTSFAGMTAVAEGVQFDLTMTLIDAGRGCAPLAGHAVYVWHCDAAGKYSIYDTPDRNYLRGVQISDATGRVRFTTVFPACYAGRWPHIHFEVFADQAAAVSGKAALLTSQLLMPEDTCMAIYSVSLPYAASLQTIAQVSVLGDNVFGNNTAEQLSVQTPVITGDPASGYAGNAQVGVVTT